MNEEERSRASSRPRILIVDDSESFCRTLTRILEREGYGTEAAGTGREGLDRARVASRAMAEKHEAGGWMLVLQDVTA